MKIQSAILSVLLIVGVCAGPTEAQVTVYWDAGYDNDPANPETVIPGSASGYAIAYSLDSLSVVNSDVGTSAWAPAAGVTVVDIPIAQPQGTPMSYTVAGLNGDTEYFVAIKARDEVSNWSDGSNIIKVKTSRHDLSSVYYLQVGSVTKIAIATVCLLALVSGVFAQSQSDVHWLTPKDANPAKYKRRALVVEVGDSTAPVFDPVINISAWGGECYFKVFLDTSEHPVQSPGRSTEVRNDINVRLLSSPTITHESMLLPDSSFEWNLVLAAKPASRTLTYNFESQGLRFYKQTPPTQQQINNGASVKRPEMMGGYAVYHSGKSHNVRRINGIDTTYEFYGTGKAFDIPRPLAWDSAGDTVDVGLEIDTIDNVVRLTLPAAFWNTATYPITIDPTFGHDLVGAAAQTLSPSFGASTAALIGSTELLTATAGWTLDSIQWEGAASSGTVEFAIALYDVSGGVPVNRHYAYDTLSTSAGFGTLTENTRSHSLDGETYCIVIGFLSGAFPQISYDVGSAGDSDTLQTVTGLPTTWGAGGTYNHLWTFVGYYTESGGPAATLSRRRTLLTGDN